MQLIARVMETIKHFFDLYVCEETIIFYTDFKPKTRRTRQINSLHYHKHPICVQSLMEHYGKLRESSTSYAVYMMEEQFVLCYDPSRIYEVYIKRKGTKRHFDMIQHISTVILHKYGAYTVGSLQEPSVFSMIDDALKLSMFDSSFSRVYDRCFLILRKVVEGFIPRPRTIYPEDLMGW